jgi:hypothetical protein
MRITITASRVPTGRNRRNCRERRNRRKDDSRSSFEALRADERAALLDCCWLTEGCDCLPRASADTCSHWSLRSRCE